MATGVLDGGFACSWLGDKQKERFFLVNMCDDVETARAGAEAAVTQRTKVDCGENDKSVAVVCDTAVVPWLLLQLQQRVRHLVVVSNARVLEVHVNDATVNTYEGAIVATNLFMHDFECDTAAWQTLKLKFFARKARDIIDVVVVCIVRDAEVLTVGKGKDENDNSGNEVAPLTVEAQLKQLELLIHSSTMMVMHRLSKIEGRISTLEQKQETRLQ